MLEYKNITHSQHIKLFKYFNPIEYTFFKFDSVRWINTSTLKQHNFSHIKRFNLTQKYAVVRPICKPDYVRNTPLSLDFVNGEINQIFIDLACDQTAISLKDSYPEVEFKVFHRVGAHLRHVDGDRKRIVVLGPTALFNNYRLTSSSGKKKEEIDKAQVICLMHSLISSNRDSDYLSYGFHRNTEAREGELTKK